MLPPTFRIFYIIVPSPPFVNRICDFFCENTVNSKALNYALRQFRAFYYFQSHQEATPKRMALILILNFQIIFLSQIFLLTEI